MKEYSFNILGRAIYDSTFSEHFRPFAHTISVVLAAHGTEILIKARIAQEHPLLIFKKIPQPASNLTELDFRTLFDEGRSYMYDDLPNRLWATTGHRISQLDQYQEFFSYRNGLVHFAVPDSDHAEKTRKFIFEVVDHLAWEFWNETFVGYAEEWDDVILDDGYLWDSLVDSKITPHPKTIEFLRKKLYKPNEHKDFE